MLPQGRLTTLKHGVTRFRITLDCFQGRWDEGRVRDRQVRWVGTAELGNLPLSMTARKIATIVVGDRSVR
jgi:A/G-specific adenine glycosylase